MINRIICGLAIVASFLATQAVAQTSACQAAPTSQFATTTGAGFTSKLLLTAGLRAPRGIKFDPVGNLLAVNQGQGVLFIQLGETNGSPCVVSTKTLITDNTLTHGIEFSADGKTLFVSSEASVFSYTYDAAAGTATEMKTLITGMTQTDHSTRTLLVSKSDPDILFVSRGSNDNIDTGATDPTNGRSVIKYYSISAISQTAVDMASSGTLLGMGLRNSVGVAENPLTGEIRSVENSMDQITRQGVDVHNNNPAEELNFHGKINDTSNRLIGANYGYPGCAAAWVPGDLTNPALKVGSQFAPNIAAGADPATEDAACANFAAPRLVFPAHNAPLDIKFNSNATAAYITFHGSWNRSPPDGYRLVRVDFGADGQPTAPADSTTASIPVMQNANTTACPGSCIRPVGLAWDSKGRLFMSSDQSNEIHVITGSL